MPRSRRLRRVAPRPRSSARPWTSSSRNQPGTRCLPPPDRACAAEPSPGSKEIIMEGSKKQYVDETRQSSPVGLIIRQKEPTNLEMPFDQVDSYLTPTGLFYIRSHFPAPRIDSAGYRLRIDGAVRNPLALSYQELREMPSATRTATLECAGNGRVFLVPQVRGAQWELGAVGNAEWTGVPLQALLERAGLEDDACEIVFEGADRGIPAEEPKPPVPISY